ncbi:hypothetical protein Sango_2707000 [Sesamum angolense]|uniref:Uncharacterized protein n=1 Tax=Sesamum angolense TaxID=2727404 RepID=A0AAE1W2W5_9LAMI|nr:hypothetical protein Sango_2707000 [Sesamum angolense]
MESGEERKRRSFGLSFADDKIKLIDILSENDDFLVASSPFCSDSLTDGTIREDGGFGHSQQVEKIPCHEFVQSSRPSFLRRSLAWDTAFFNSAGVLDPDELSFINKGYRTTIDVRNRRSESGPMMLPTGGGLSLDWFEIEPLSYDSAPAALKKVDESSRNEVMSGQASTRKSIFVQSEEKIKKTASNRRRPGRVPSPKPPNVFGRKTMDLSMTSRKELSRKSSIKVDKKSATAVADEKTSSNHNYTSLPSPQFSSVVSPASPIVSTAAVPLLGTSRLSSPVSASKIWGHTERRKGIGHLSLSTRSSYLSDGLSCLPPGSSTSPWVSDSPSPVCNKQRSNEAKVRKIFPGPFQSDGKEASNLRISLNSPLGSQKDYSSQAMISRPSGLRPPSPQIRFFDENTPPKHDGTTRSRKIPRKVVPGESLQESRIGSRHASASVKLTSPHSGTTGKNIKRSKIEYTNSFMKIGSADDVGKRPVNKHGPNSCQEENKRRDKLKNKARGGSRWPEREVEKSSDQENGKKNMSRSSDQLGNLSEYFDAIDLNLEKGQELKRKQARFRSDKNNVQNNYTLIKKENQMLESPQSAKDAASMSGMRAPLADKTSDCNSSEEFGFSKEPKKERLVQRAAVCASSASATREKENSEKAELPH